ncbi:hypothetical protein CpB0713 [Chlamydia pneumoniae TW-183]|uniref:Uncharacterized protein n=2 Tax=Chlamydia pneumoniae TaxID=83558 RepID=Q9Z7L8_CHLPN|nr:hypothetical protein CPn_0686 [Chlamydia pneumoniae CWL029]AAF37949.1 hypothetical protein CP_0060 [Chlamydia pneumoniae AR39]AAP98642.1 hypothetical protein CpB0713 [Chlamydia pneumoniae TW-183]BAA98893.1 hypothetical protein [Chlamydia pneumoniae J138]
MMRGGRLFRVYQELFFFSSVYVCEQRRPRKLYPSLQHLNFPIEKPRFLLKGFKKELHFYNHV